jgi:Negative regulator of beta-lactamase expression
MSLKIGIKLTSEYSFNFSLPKREKKRIKFIIIHYTGMKKESSSIKKLCDPKSKVSSHYYIKKNGSILNLVPDLYEAWHAGESKWKTYKSLNKYSIGIELTNPGHQHGYRNFSLKQISSLKKLIKYLSKKYKISYKSILGHSDISPNRKKDPGEKFPWKESSKR